MVTLNKNFWEDRYANQTTGWDLGGISTPLKTYFNQLKNKDLKILIPGCGNSYEAEFLYNNGFTKVYVNDITQLALENFKNRVPNFPASQLIHSDFFDLDIKFDLIIEQTFFCALNPKLRATYAKKAHELLNPNGKLVGLLFNTELNKDCPPFGGSTKEYLTYFKPYFGINTFEPCYNSVVSRKDKELFINLSKAK